jgi:hypothetical protein
MGIMSDLGGDLGGLARVNLAAAQQGCKRNREKFTTKVPLTNNDSRMLF